MYQNRVKQRLGTSLTFYSRVMRTWIWQDLMVWISRQKILTLVIHHKRFLKKKSIMFSWFSGQRFCFTCQRSQVQISLEWKYFCLFYLQNQSFWGYFDTIRPIVNFWSLIILKELQQFIMCWNGFFRRPKPWVPLADLAVPSDLALI